jgi:hypothetical protein
MLLALFFSTRLLVTPPSGVPTEVLIAKIEEGLAKNVAPARILDAVDRLASTRGSTIVARRRSSIARPASPTPRLPWVPRQSSLVRSAQRPMP